MNIAQVRSQFSVYVLAPNLEQGKNTLTALSAVQYTSELFDNKKTLLERMTKEPSHILVVHLDSVIKSFQDFMVEMNESFPELLTIVIGDREYGRVLKEYARFGVYQFLSKSEDLESELIWAVDRASEHLYLIYQNETLAGQCEAHKNHDLQAKDLQTVFTYTSLSEKTVNRDELLSVFLDHVCTDILKQKSGIFFRFLPPVYSFVATQSVGIPIEKVKGVGFKLNPEEAKNLTQTLSHIASSRSFLNLMDSAFETTEYAVEILNVASSFEGFFVFLTNEKSVFVEKKWSLVVNIMRKQYEIFHLQRKLKEIEVRDEVTQFLLPSQYVRKVEDEFVRARRNQQPMCIVILKIDKLDEHVSKVGEHHRDIIVKAVSSIVRRTSRTNDITVRLSTDQIALILPNCSMRGGGIRAERLRRTIESTSISMQPNPVTICAGISEYPSVAATSDQLMARADEAVRQVSERGGNKVCLSVSEPDFAPDFYVSNE